MSTAASCPEPLPTDPGEGLRAIGLMDQHDAEQGQARQVMEVAIGPFQGRVLSQ